jgi:hypothetical protein
VNKQGKEMDSDVSLEKAREGLRRAFGGLSKDTLVFIWGLLVPW